MPLLRSSDGKLLRVPYKVLRQSILLNNLLEDSEYTDTETVKEENSVKEENIVKEETTVKQENTVKKENLVKEESIVKEEPSIAEGEDVIPIPNVNFVILTKVIEWMEAHKDDPPHKEEEPHVEAFKQNIPIEISEWDASFLRVDKDTLLEIILVCSISLL